MLMRFNVKKLICPFLCVSLLVFASSCTIKSSQDIKSITIGRLPIEAHLLFFIAQDQNYFGKNGLTVKTKDYDTGGAVKGLFNGEVDIAFTGEFAAVQNSFERSDFQILSCVDKYQYFYMAARKDSGIVTPSDVKNKKIGVALGINSQFYLGRFLELNRMSLKDVQVVPLQASQYVSAIGNKDVDAVVFMSPYYERIREQLGANGVYWSVQSAQPLFSVMIARSEWTVDHADEISRLLKSLVQAESYLTKNQEQSRAILQKYLNVDASYVQSIWPDNQFNLSLDLSLIIAMEDEARWMQSNSLTTEKQIPNFLNYIHEGALKAVKPEAVNIIR
jgi:ABC-type nitrate/sulfonate/bicarbonate transport system substrate-binding protein